MKKTILGLLGIVLVAGAQAQSFEVNERIAFRLEAPIDAKDNEAALFIATAYPTGQPTCKMVGRLISLRRPEQWKREFLPLGDNVALQCSGWSKSVRVFGHFEAGVDKTGWAPVQETPCVRMSGGKPPLCAEYGTHVNAKTYGYWTFTRPVSVDEVRAAHD